MKAHKLVNPTITNWAIILPDAAIAALCLVIANAIVRPEDATGSSTSLYLITLVACHIAGSVWVKPLVNLPGTRFYRIMERTFHKVLLTGVLAAACLFFTPGAMLLRTFLATFLPVFYVALLLTRAAEHALFKRRFSRLAADEAHSPEVPCGLHNTVNRIVKRTFDILLSLALLLTLYPVVYLLLFIYTKIRRRGAVYTAMRLCGPDGGEFTCVRFGALRAGNVLNSLPRLFCVLTGSMSIAGTRPCLPTDIMQGRRAADGDGGTRMAKPGLTGWARLEGYESEEEEAALDRWYVDRWSFGLDVFIILKGLGTLLFKRNKR